MKMITVGFIGNGKSTNRYHLPFLLKTGKFRVKTIYNRSLKEDWKRMEGVAYTTDLEALLEDPEIDLVVVTTPINQHYSFAKLALEAGKHVLLEKPFTRTLEEAKALFALARSKGLLLEGYQNRRFDSDFLTTLKVVASGQIGKLQELEMHFDYDRPEVPEAVTDLSLETSFLYNHGCHTLEQVISYFGAPDRVHYDLRQLLGQGRMNDYFDLDLYYDQLKVSVKSSYFRVKPRPSFVAYGDKGVFVKACKDRQEEDLKRFYMPDNPDFGLDRPEDFGLLSLRTAEGKIEEMSIPSEKGDYSLFYEALYKTLTGQEPPLVEEGHTLAVMEILETGFKLLDRES